MLADIVAVNTNEGIKTIAEKLYRQIRGIEMLYDFDSDTELSKTISPLCKSIKERELLISETEEEIIFVILTKIYLFSKGYTNSYISLWQLMESLSSNKTEEEMLKKYIEILVTKKFLESKSIGTISITHNGIKKIENLIEKSFQNNSNLPIKYQFIHSVKQKERYWIEEIQKLRYTILKQAFDLSSQKNDIILNIFKIGKPFGIEKKKLERIFFYLEYEGLINFYALGGDFFITNKG